MKTLICAAVLSLGFLGCATGQPKVLPKEEGAQASAAKEDETLNNGPSFFKPKTEGDVNAMATMSESDFSSEITEE